MTHTNDAQTVQTCQTRSVRKPRPRLIFETRLVFKARRLLVQLRQTPAACIRGRVCIRGNTVLFAAVH